MSINNISKLIIGFLGVLYGLGTFLLGRYGVQEIHFAIVIIPVITLFFVCLIGAVANFDFKA